jgi:hypothetical protein
LTELSLHDLQFSSQIRRLLRKATAIVVVISGTEKLENTVCLKEGQAEPCIFDASNIADDHGFVCGTRIYTDTGRYSSIKNTLKGSPQVIRGQSRSAIRGGAD